MHMCIGAISGCPGGLACPEHVLHGAPPPYNACYSRTACPTLAFQFTEPGLLQSQARLCHACCMQEHLSQADQHDTSCTNMADARSELKVSWAGLLRGQATLVPAAQQRQAAAQVLTTSQATTSTASIETVHSSSSPEITKLKPARWKSSRPRISACIRH